MNALGKVKCADGEYEGTYCAYIVRWVSEVSKGLTLEYKVRTVNGIRGGSKVKVVVKDGEIKVVDKRGDAIELRPV